MGRTGMLRLELDSGPKSLVLLEAVTCYHFTFMVSYLLVYLTVSSRNKPKQDPFSHSSVEVDYLNFPTVAIALTHLSDWGLEPVIFKV